MVFMLNVTLGVKSACLFKSEAIYSDDHFYMLADILFVIWNKPGHLPKNE